MVDIKPILLYFLLLQEIASIEASKIVISAIIVTIAGIIIATMVGIIIVVIVIVIGVPDLEAIHVNVHEAHTNVVRIVIHHQNHHLHHHKRIHKQLIQFQHQIKKKNPNEYRTDLNDDPIYNKLLVNLLTEHYLIFEFQKKIEITIY